jgi:hypothetical protein
LKIYSRLSIILKKSPLPLPNIARAYSVMIASSNYQ